MKRKTGTTRLKEAQGFPDDVSPSTARQANRAIRRWLNGEVDGVDCRTTPSGERIVQPYQRDET